MPERWTVALLAVVLATAGCVGGENAPPLEDQQADDPDPEGDQTGANGTQPADASPSRDEDGDSAGDDNGTAGDGDAAEDDGAGNETDDGNTSVPPPSFAGLAAAEIRPGVGIGAPEASELDGTPLAPNWTCTSSFVLLGPENRTLYIATSARCLSGVSIGGTVPVADGVVEGRLAYSSLTVMDRVGESDDEVRRYNDLALVSLPPEAVHLTSPAVLHWGGPTGLATDTQPRDRATAFGNASLHGPAHEAKRSEGYVHNASAWATWVHMEPAPVEQDAGGPVLTADGRALGLLQPVSTEGSIDEEAPTSSVPPGLVPVTNLAPALAYAQAHAGFELHLPSYEQLAQPDAPEAPEPPAATAS